MHEKNVQKRTKMSTETHRFKNRKQTNPNAKEHHSFTDQSIIGP